MNPYKFADLPPINDCPFCYGTDPVLNEALHVNSWVSCPACESTGPSHEDNRKAIILWNEPTEVVDHLRKDCDRLRRELDDEMGIIR